MFRHCFTRVTLGAAIGASLALACGLALASSDQPPTRRTGAPGERTCTGCHLGALDDGQGALTISGVPESYVPGQRYAVTVSLSRAGKSRWGFELTVLRKADNTMAGSVTTTHPSTMTQVVSGKTYVSQTTLLGLDGTYAGITGGPVSWTFDWTAPAAGADSVVFYAAGVAADNSQDADPGDLVYTSRVTSAQGSTTPVAAKSWGALKRRHR